MWEDLEEEDCLYDDEVIKDNNDWLIMMNRIIKIEKIYEKIGKKEGE